MVNRHEVVIIGAGQAGLALSHHLCRKAVDHVVLEQGRVANAWCEDRWDSFCLVTPNWTITLPGAEYQANDLGGFLSRNQFVDHLTSWANGFDAPIRDYTRALKVLGDQSGFVIETDRGDFRANHVVVATATYQTARLLPGLAKAADQVLQIPASDYRNPTLIPEGGVLILGGGQTGCQIAEELNAAGFAVFLSVGRSGRLPRRYRGQDCILWQRDMGWLDRTPDKLEHPGLRFRGDPHLTGAQGGRTLSLHELRADGVNLLGRLDGGCDGILNFRDDLNDSLVFSDQYAADFRASVDKHIEATGQSAPSPTATEMFGEPSLSITKPLTITSLDLRARSISTIILAIGFEFDFSWIAYPVFDNFGYPVTDRGSTSIPGLHFLGLNWMHKRKSGIIYGVAEDAKNLANRILGPPGCCI
ncbi:MAG: FAD-dependent oxidoreductase [Rhodospirillaceae bacterium]|nr:FAD-dependent oxidoreductase [Rhodospirillaceae bacterium]